MEPLFLRGLKPTELRSFSRNLLRHDEIVEVGELNLELAGCNKSKRVEESPFADLLVPKGFPFSYPLIRLYSGHFLRHEKQQSAVALIRAAQQAAEFGQHSSILSGTAPFVA